MPVGPWYDDAGTPSRSSTLGSLAKPVTATGREYTTSARKAPTSTTRRTPSPAASSAIRSQKRRQRRCGSTPQPVTSSRDPSIEP